MSPNPAHVPVVAGLLRLKGLPGDVAGAIAPMALDKGAFLDFDDDPLTALDSELRRHRTDLTSMAGYRHVHGEVQRLMTGRRADTAAFAESVTDAEKEVLTAALDIRLEGVETVSWHLVSMASDPEYGGLTRMLEDVRQSPVRAAARESVVGKLTGILARQRKALEDFVKELTPAEYAVVYKALDLGLF